MTARVGLLGALLLGTTLLLASLLAHGAGCTELACGLALGAFLVTAATVAVRLHNRPSDPANATGRPTINR